MWQRGLNRGKYGEWFGFGVDNMSDEHWSRWVGSDLILVFRFSKTNQLSVFESNGPDEFK